MSSASKYYEMRFDADLPEQWYIKSPVDARGEWIIPWKFFQGKPVHLEDEPFVPLFRPGLALDYSVTETGIAVLSQSLVALWKRLGVQEEVQFIPTRIEGQTERYFILNTLRIIRCVDDARCEEVTFWESRHGDPERVGHYRSVMGLKIDPAAVGGTRIFRPWGWKIVLIVSGRIKQAMEEEGLRGAEFVTV